jgi:hypothetical protein
MNPNDTQSDHDFGASFQLPEGAQTPRQDGPVGNPAADLVRKKVQAAYAQAPDATEEALDLAEEGDAIKRSKHQQYIYNLTNSGKSLAEIQQAWREYYDSLSDEQKHEVWQEFYSVHSQTSKYAAAQNSMAPQGELSYEDMPIRQPDMNSAAAPVLKTVTKTLGDLRDFAVGNVTNKQKIKPMQHLQSLMFGLGVGSIVLLIFLFSFFNERFMWPIRKLSPPARPVEIHRKLSSPR